MTDEHDSPRAVYLHQIRLLEQERDSLVVQRDSWTERAREAKERAETWFNKLSSAEAENSRIKTELDMLGEEFAQVCARPCPDCVAAKAELATAQRKLKEIADAVFMQVYGAVK